MHDTARTRASVAYVLSSFTTTTPSPGMPPPLAFPIIWSTIGVLRAISSVMIYKATGSFFALPILAFIGHLCIGDTWNTINNVEKLKGTSAASVIFVLASVYHAIFRYRR